MGYSFPGLARHAPVCGLSQSSSQSPSSFSFHIVFLLEAQAYKEGYGSRYPKKKKFGIKCPNGYWVKTGRILVKQRKRRIEYWPGKNVKFSRDMGLVAMANGRMTWSYDPVKERRYVSILGEGEDPENFVIPKTPRQIRGEIFHTKRELRSSRKERIQELVVHMENRQFDANNMLSRPKPTMNTLTEIIADLTSSSRHLTPVQQTFTLQNSERGKSVDLVD